jgi:hypothetical protein
MGDGNKKSQLNGDSLATWILSVRFPARRPLVPGTSVVIRDVLELPVDDEEAVVWERASLKPGGMRTRLAVAGASAFLRFDMSGGWKKDDTCTSGQRVIRVA